MDPISGIGTNLPPQPVTISDSGDDGQSSGDNTKSVGNPDSSKNLSLLKKSQDLAKDTASRLLELLPQPRSANPPGVGDKIDLTA